jgi:hypothetical protein
MYGYSGEGGALILKLLSQITAVKHFDLQDVSRLAETMADDDSNNADTWLSAYDIKEMFTGLKKETVLDAAWDLIQLVGNHYGGMNTGYYVIHGSGQPAHIGKAPCMTSCSQGTFMDTYEALNLK